MHCAVAQRPIFIAADHLYPRPAGRRIDDLVLERLPLHSREDALVQAEELFRQTRPLRVSCEHDASPVRPRTPRQDQFFGYSLHHLLLVEFANPVTIAQLGKDHIGVAPQCGHRVHSRRMIAPHPRRL